MDITILYKWGYDPDDAYITSDGSFRWKQGRLVASDDDAAAIASAREVAQATGGRLTGVTIGNGDASWAAARGAQSIATCDGLLPVSDDAAMSAQLCDAVKAVDPAEIIVVSGNTERAGVAPTLAAMLDIPCVLGVRDFSIDAENAGFLVAHRATDDGVETLRFAPPVVVSVVAASSEKNVPSMKEALAARKAPKAQITVEPRGTKVGVELLCKAELKHARIFEGDADAAARELVAALREDGIL